MQWKQNYVPFAYSINPVVRTSVNLKWIQLDK